jgi:hypothetical protein
MEQRSYSNVARNSNKQFNFPQRFGNFSSDNDRFDKLGNNRFSNVDVFNNPHRGHSKFSNFSSDFITKQNNIKKDPEYIKKLDLSYTKCLYELCNPPNWEEKISDAKFIVVPGTGMPMKNYTFDLSGKDSLDITEVTHSYIFKRSHFYGSFDKQPRSFLKRDLINCWRNRGYFVKLHKVDVNGKWLLTIGWK